jgi:hypothetical protein
MSVTTVPREALSHRIQAMAKKVSKPDGSSTPTSLVRLHTDVVDLAQAIAGVFQESVPDFLSNLLRPILEEKQKEAVERLKKWKPKPAE